MADLAPFAAKSDIKGSVHTAWHHDSAKKHVAGNATYIDDIVEPAGLLNIYVAMSPKAHAKIKSVDLSMVRESPGVALVLTADDVPGENDASPHAGDDPVFAEEKVEYAGQSLFAVAADTIEQARHAATKSIHFIRRARAHRHNR